MSIRISHVKGAEWSIVSSAYSPALRDAARLTPGMRWEPAMRAWCGYADAVHVCSAHLTEKGIRVEGAIEAEPNGLDTQTATMPFPVALKNLRDYQQEAVKFLILHAHEGALLADDMGLGKSACALRAARYFRGQTLIVCPAFIKGVWMEEAAKWWPTARVVELEGTKATGLDPTNGDADLFVINYDILHAWAETLAKSIRTVVFDECFPAGTLVDTADGDRPIEELEIEDVVRNAIGWGRVSGTSERLVDLDELTLIEMEDGREWICTANHPWLTPTGWARAADLMAGVIIVDVVQSNSVWRSRGGVGAEGRLGEVPCGGPRETKDSETMSGVPQDSPDVAGEQALFDLLCAEVEIPSAAREARPSQTSEERSAAFEDIGGTSTLLQGQRRRGAEDIGGLQPKNAPPQSNVDAGREEEGERLAEKTRGLGAPYQRGQWPPTATSGASASTGARQGVASGGSCYRETSYQRRSTDALQDRSGELEATYSCRGRRNLAHGAGPQDGRQAQGSVPTIARVARIALPQRADLERLGLRPPDRQGRVRVHNISVSGHPSYSVSGLVVHNCHALQSEKSRRSKAAKVIARAASRRIGLSGTPMTNRPRDLWNVVDTLSEGRFGNFFAYCLRHADAHKEEVARDKVVWIFDGASNLEELNVRMRRFMLRRTIAEVGMQLPGKQRQAVVVQPKRMRLFGPNVQTLIRGGRINDEALRKALNLAADGKIGDVIDLVRSHVNEGRKVVVFTYRRAFAEAIAEAAYDGQATFIHGGVPLEERTKRMKKQPSVLAATIDVTAGGISLVYADVAVFAEMTWEPHELIQCERRLWRFGQKKPVLIQYVIARTSVDELVRKVVIDKLANFETAIGKTGESLSADLMRDQKASVEERLKDLFTRLSSVDQ
jgi:superfamily II DNA or RNA helicase